MIVVGPNNYKVISDVETKEISIVPWGANNKSFLLIKDKDGKITKDQIMFWNKLEGGNMVKEEPKVKPVVKEEPKIEPVIKEEPKIEPVIKEDVEKVKLAKELTDLRKELANAIELAQIEKNIRLTNDKIQFAKESFTTLGDHTELGRMLKEASEVMKKESYDLLITTLKSAEEKIKLGSVFTEIGKDSTQSAITGSNKIEKLAKEYMEKNHVDYSTAVQHIIEKDQSLFEEYEKSVLPNFS